MLSLELAVEEVIGESLRSRWWSGRIPLLLSLTLTVLRTGCESKDGVLAALGVRTKCESEFVRARVNGGRLRTAGPALSVVEDDTAWPV